MIMIYKKPISNFNNKNSIKKLIKIFLTKLKIYMHKVIHEKYKSWKKFWIAT